MKVYNLLSLFILGFFVISCGNSNQKNSANFSLQIGEKDENIQQGINNLETSCVNSELFSALIYAKKKKFITFEKKKFLMKTKKNY